MKLLILGLLAVTLAMPRAMAVNASPAQKPNPDITRREATNFDRFLDSHPAIDHELRKNPALINNSEYIAKHPELKEFLENHPGVREETKETPRYFVRRAEKFDNSARDIRHAELVNFDRFLDSHPNIDQDLRKNPRLVDNPNYISQHPELREFLAAHPAVREDLKEHPKAFMQREKKLDKREE